MLQRRIKKLMLSIGAFVGTREKMGEEKKACNLPHDARGLRRCEG